MTRLDEPEAAKAALLERAAEVADRSHGGETSRDRALAFLRRYYLHVSPQDLIGRDPVDVYGAAMSHKQLAVSRPQGTARVRVFTPTLDEQGWSSGHTVVEVVTDDMPFLVDTVTAELNRQDRAIHLVIHPQLYVRRALTGELQEVLDLDDLTVPPPPETELESWMHVEIDRETDEKDLEQITADLQRVLRDVREAVEDWPKMRAAAVRIADELHEDPPPLPEVEVAEAEELMRWLADEHFTFLGYREYDLVSVVDTNTDNSDASEMALKPVPGTGLGILRSDKPVSDSFGKLSRERRAKAHEQRLLVLSKANSRSTVHRSVYLDYVGVKKFDDEGRVIGERRFLGLLTSSAYIESVTRIPVVRRRVQDVLDRAGFSVMSHSGKDMLEILETFPRDELFQTDTDQLLPVVTAVLHLRERRQLRLFLRRDDYDRFVSCLVYLPRDRYTTAVRLKMQRILLDALGGTAVDYTARVTESVLARLHFVVRMPTGQPLPDVDVTELERRLAEATRTWSDDFSDAILDQCGEESAATLLRNYGDAFPEAYKEDFPARTAVSDLKRLAALGDDPSALDLNLYEPYGASRDERRFKVYRVGSPISLAVVLPVLQEMGVEVVDERPYEIERRDGVNAWIYDFGLRYRGEVPEGPIKDRFQEAFAALWRGDAEVDSFNALVLQAGLSWRQTSILRAYARYMRQGGSTFSQDYIEESLLAHVDIARLLVQLFELRFDPARLADAARSDDLVREITAALDAVASLDRDRILRTFLAMILATLRTNYFQTDDAGNPKSWLSFKLDPTSVPDLPMPRPRFEIWVYSPRVEGVHLRFGPVARGGLRWSDRREDFRTEVLGLVKAQTVKNAVIVPVGAKGGFVVKQPVDDPSNREAVMAEGVACYTTFIRGLLDVTDNRVAGAIAQPHDVVRHDGDDPYLVVAADKGTATFSDIANGIAADYGFWLGDAFASGGSSGYDHKAMGITARGAWVSVQRHFREMGVDVQREDITVVGIGDMSGDVFGNGMLLSEHLRLVAAFDHRHVFLDPSPDAAVSFKERQRLFELPRSSWADYDATLISPGGGVYPRDAKSVPISAEVREALGIAGDVTALTPNELMHAILMAPVDLLWNGGIGTYVKASTETNAAVGDKGNDAIRVDGSELRCKAVGEGGNLGLTQLGRVEYALAGGRINTDAIDNSAGVDTSDHEVNIKILLDRIVDNGDLTHKQRNSLLAEMTDEVAAHVLNDNYGQNVAIACGLWQAPSLADVHGRFIRFLERRGHLNRALEFLPTDRQLAERRAQGRGLTAPEFAVLLSYTKIVMKRELLASDLPEDPYLQTELEAYFPHQLREQFGAQIAAHPLRREIITTRIVNNIVNNAGTTFMFRLSDETGATTDELARAHTVARVVYDMPTLWSGIEALDNRVDAAIQTRMELVGRTIVERGSRWLVNNRRPPIDIAKTIEQFRAGVAEIIESMPTLLVGRDLEQFQARRDMLLEHGVPEALAIRVSSMPPAFAALSIVEIATSRARSVDEVARLHFYLGEELRLGLLLERIIALPRDDRWQTMARAALRDDLHSAHAALTAEVLESGPDGATPEQRLSEWQERSASVITRAEATVDEVAASDVSDLAMLSVALRAIRTLVGSRTRS